MTPIINLSHISYNYEEVSALNDISLEIYAGELIFFTGPNGCGKSTLFKLLNGLIFPTKGEYYFDNKKIDKNTLQDNIFAKNFHKRIGYIFQNPDVQLFNATVYDEIAFAPRQMNLDEDIIHQRVNELLIYLNIQHLQNRPSYHLSGGAPDVWSGRTQLQKLQSQYGKDITFLAGSGVNAQNVKALMEYTSIEQVHTSCRSWQPDATASLQDVDFSYDRNRKNAYEAVDAGKVKEMRAAMPIL